MAEGGNVLILFIMFLRVWVDLDWLAHFLLDTV